MLATSLAAKTASSRWRRRTACAEAQHERVRVDWATLLRRTFDVDVTRCTGCAGRMTVRAVVTDPASIDRLLAALRRARDPPVAA